MDSTNRWKAAASALAIAAAVSGCTAPTAAPRAGPIAQLPPLDPPSPEAASFGPSVVQTSALASADGAEGLGVMLVETPEAEAAGALTPPPRPRPADLDTRATLNLEDADIAEAAKLILSDILGAPYVIDQRVRGRVTLSSERPLSGDELLAALETALASNQAVLVERPEGYVIAPVTDATAGGLTLRDPRSPGFGVSVLPLVGIDAETVRVLLDGALARPGVVRVDRGRNLLFVVGPAAERRAVMEAAKALEGSGLAGRATALVPLAEADPAEVATELLAALDAEAGGALEGAIRATPIPRLQSILITAQRPDLLERARAWLDALDRASQSRSVLRTYFVQNGRAVDVASVLGQLISSEGGSGAAPVAPDQAVATAQTGGAASGPMAFGGGGGSGPAGLDARIVADPINNALLVMADAEGHDFVGRAIADLDRPPLQVVIDAIIAEVTLSDDLRFGVQYFFQTAGVDNIADAGRGGFSSGGGFDANGIFPGFNLLFETGDQARLAIDALSSITEVEIVSNPTIMTRDNQPGLLSVGDKVPVVTRQATSVIDPDSPVVNSVEFRDTGVILEVTPRIGSNGLVIMDVTQEVSSVRATASDAPSLTPTISQRRIVTSVAVPNGQTVVLGGLIDDTRSLTRRGLPVLSKLPRVGGLFGSTSESVRRTELLVFLTPRVVRDARSIAEASEEVRARMEALGAAAETDHAKGQTAEPLWSTEGGAG